jgi:hypothetical protein
MSALTVFLGDGEEASCAKGLVGNVRVRLELVLELIGDRRYVETDPTIVVARIAP